jgi:hypothetical protein
MLRSSRKVALKTYKIPSETAFKLSMATERRILGVRNNGSEYFLLVEEPTGSSTKDFDFVAVTLGQEFDMPNRYSYLGSYLVVVDADADRPASEERMLYGVEQGESMGGAL